MDIKIDLTGVTLETERLLLRPFSGSDLDDFYEYASIEGTGEMAGWKHHGSREDTQSVLNIFIAEKNIFAVVLKENSKVIGSLGLHPSWGEDEPELNKLRQKEIGYVLSREYWGMGLMPEAVKRLITFCFEELELDLVTVGHFDSNKQSKRVIEKCGFEFYKNGVYEAKQLGITMTSRKYIKKKA